jgi:alanine dehydrogenase
VVESIWIRPGTHINALGADAEGKQEIESTVLNRARVFVDDREQAAHSGEVNVPLHKHAWALTSLAGTLGEVVVGRVKARHSDEDITLFDSTGLAVQDVALARAVFEAAKEESCGTMFDFQLSGT